MQNLIYFTQYAKQDNLAGDRTEFLVLLNRLPHSINSYHAGFLHNIVKTVNGKQVTGLADMKKALASPVDGYHQIQFETTANTLEIDA